MLVHEKEIKWRTPMIRRPASISRHNVAWATSDDVYVDSFQ